VSEDGDRDDGGGSGRGEGCCRGAPVPAHPAGEQCGQDEYAAALVDHPAFGKFAALLRWRGFGRWVVVLGDDDVDQRALGA